MQQLIFTSVPRGYQTGASGYCTAARSEQMRPGLVQRLEQMSVYSHRTVSPNPTILAYRLVDLGGVKYRVLSRIRDAGLDFTKRSNFIAHHLAFEPGESVGGASPAEILLFWDGWKDQWEGNPSALQDEKGDTIGSHVKRLSPPCKHWEDLTGDPGWGAFPLNHSGSCCWVHEKLDEFELLHLMGESLRLKSSGNVDALWETSLTTYLGTIVEASKYNWSAWNELDPIPTGKELGKNLIRVESLKGDPIGSKEMIEIARGGHPSSAPTSNIKQAQITPNEIKNQPKDRISIDTIKWKEAVTEEFVPNTVNKQKYLPGVIVIATIGISVLAFFSYKNMSEKSQKSSDAALIDCIDNISSNLSSTNRNKEAPNYKCDLTEKQLSPLKEKDRELIRSLAESVKKMSPDDASVENVLKKLRAVKELATTPQADGKISALMRKVNQMHLKQKISERISLICQNSVIDYDRDLNELNEISTKWDNEIPGTFPYKCITEITQIAKEYSSLKMPSRDQYRQLLERLENYKANPEAEPYRLRVIQHEKVPEEKAEKSAEHIPISRIDTATLALNSETRKLESHLLEELFDKKFVETIFKDIPTGSVSYIFDDFVPCPEAIKDCKDIAKMDVLGKYNRTPIETNDVFDEKRFLKSPYRQQSKTGLVLVCKKAEKTYILVYKTTKPLKIGMNSKETKNGIFNDLEIFKKYLEKAIIRDSEGQEVMRWIVTDATDKPVYGPFGVLNIDTIKKISEKPYELSKQEYLNEFQKVEVDITNITIEKLWENHLPFTNDDIKNIDEAVKEYLRLKESPSRIINGKDEKEKADKIQIKIKEIRSKYKLYYEDTELDKNRKPEQTLEQFGESINIKVKKLRAFLFLPSQDVTQIKRQEYNEIYFNKRLPAVSEAWAKYQKYLENKNKTDQPQPQKEYEWLTNNLLLEGGKYKLYFGPSDLQYFQMISD